MSRWIDADALTKEIKQDIADNGLTERYVFYRINNAPSIDIVRCGECVYYDPPHVDDNGKRIEYKDLPKEAFDKLGTGFVDMSYGINVGGRCCVDYNCGYAEDKRVYRAEDNFCSKGRRPLYSSEKPNNSKERSSK
jgi:hypothetical protein